MTLTIVVGVAGLCVALTASLIEELGAGGTGEGAAIEDILKVIAIGSALAALTLVPLAGRRTDAG